MLCFSPADEAILNTDISVDQVESPDEEAEVGRLLGEGEVNRVRQMRLKTPTSRLRPKIGF